MHPQNSSQASAGPNHEAVLSTFYSVLLLFSGGKTPKKIRTILFSLYHELQPDIQLSTFQLRGKSGKGVCMRPP